MCAGMMGRRAMRIGLVYTTSKKDRRSGDFAVNAAEPAGYDSSCEVYL
ncbi:hypothetical protein MFUM_690058 [Methylacidiphilum fumariolicum SolV]|uniref:Uncharacterized protein n=2 Tax=Candidatus Methylacidiphilum fumarolicum TaxID=591154 RepID=I0JYU2_METFB|nr:conserved protein of unknown function [Candidatus Methylacidiphilum fumarolicum]CCG92411.1 hypothetical protein MFUM_690058 [Methylacidiphilum fumariolicum SolV]